MRNDVLPNLFGSKLRAKVLGWLFTHTDERYFVRQLTSLLKEDSTNISRELARLEKMGILELTTSGRQKYYQANLKSPIYNELHGLMVKTTGVSDIIRSYLVPVSQKIKLAFIFGSIAGRTETRASDVDVMIIGDIDYDEAASCLNLAQDKIGREINSVVYPILEFQQKIKNNQHFLKSVLAGEKIYLIGDESELTRLVN
jgi:uncharacterized protein